METCAGRRAAKLARARAPHYVTRCRVSLPRKLAHDATARDRIGRAAQGGALPRRALIDGVAVTSAARVARVHPLLDVAEIVEQSPTVLLALGDVARRAAAARRGHHAVVVVTAVARGAGRVLPLGRG